MNVGKPSPAALAAKRRQQQASLRRAPSDRDNGRPVAASARSPRDRNGPAPTGAPSSAGVGSRKAPTNFGTRAHPPGTTGFGRPDGGHRTSGHGRENIPSRDQLEKSEGYRRPMSRSSGRSRSVASDGRENWPGAAAVLLGADSDGDSDVTEVNRRMVAMGLEASKQSQGTNRGNNTNGRGAPPARSNGRGNNCDGDRESSAESWDNVGPKFGNLLGMPSASTASPRDEESDTDGRGSRGSWDESDDDDDDDVHLTRTTSSGTDDGSEDDETSRDEDSAYGIDDALSEDFVVDDDSDHDSDDDGEESEPAVGASPDDYTDDEDEGEDGYKPGGYHPVKFGEVYGRRYVVIKKLGWGHFSTVWMVRDTQVRDGDPRQFLALKVQKSAEHYTEAAMDEIELLDCAQEERRRAEDACMADRNGTDELGVSNVEVMQESRHNATLVHSFFHFGPNGRHMCMVFEMLGCNLLSVIKAHNYRGVPIEAVQTMMRGICKGLDFLHRKCSIIHTDLKPENVLLQFVPPDPDASNNKSPPSKAVPRSPGHVKGPTPSQQQQQHHQHHPQVVTIEEIEALLGDPKTSTEDRKRLRKKLKRKRQREKKKQQRKENLMASNHDNILDETCDDSDTFADTSGIAPPSPSGGPGIGSFSFLSDEMVLYIMARGNVRWNGVGLLGGGSSSRSQQSSAAFTHNVRSLVPGSIRKVDESALVQENFTLEPAKVNCLDTILGDASARSLTSRELFDEFDNLRDGGMAEVSFLLRTFVPEGELADNLSRVIGVDWVRSQHTGATREWCCGFSLSLPGMALEQEATFQLIQKNRKELDSHARKMFVNSIDLVSREIVRCSFSQKSASSRMNGAEVLTQLLPFSLFTLRFPVASTMVVLGFLESKVPGLVFLLHKQNSVSSQLNQVAFGKNSDMICRHPAKNVKEIHSGGEGHRVPSSIIGFDMRMVKEFGARPKLGEDGVACFVLGGPMDTVNVWWSMRKPIEDRIGLLEHPASPGLNKPISQDSSDMLRQISPANSSKKTSKPNMISPNKTSSPPASPRKVSESPSIAASARIAALTSPVNLKNLETLKSARTVIVDLGNACWTHRHFSDDIQTRQYRSPEVITGSKYDTSADMWSLGCICFELLTGDLLFDPRAGEDYDRDEDHLAMFQELLGKMPKKLALSGKYSKNFFSRRGDLKHIQQLKFWPIDEVLHDKYHFPREEAREIAAFMLPLLEFNPKKRATALDCIRSKWLKEEVGGGNKTILRRRRPSGRGGLK